MFYILYGEDDFSLREALSDIRKRLGDEEWLATSTSVFQGASLVPEQLVAACDTVPFLAPYRLVIVEGLLTLFERQEKGKQPGRGRTSQWAVLKDYVKRVPETTVLVLIDGKLKKDNPLLRELAPQAEAREFKPLQDERLKAWMGRRAAERGVSLSPGALAHLEQLVGGNLWALSNEIDKLSLYARGRTVEKKDVMAVVSEAREFSIFDLVDAILARNSTEAMRLLHKLEDEGDAPSYILFMLTRQLRLVVQVKDLSQQKRPPDEIKRSLAIKDFVLQKTLRQAKARSGKELEAVYRKLLDTDIAIKTGRFKAEKGERGGLALDLLVTELCAEPS